jgi:hypothetical protein
MLEFWRHPQLATGHFARLRSGDWIGWLCLMVVLSFIAEAIGYLMLHLLDHAIPNDRFINHMASHPSWRFAALLLVAPVFEELTFRCFLTESPRAIVVGLGFFGALLVGLLVHGVMALAGKHFLPTHDIACQYFVNVATAMLIAALLAGVAWIFRRGLLRALRRYAAWAFWISALLFAAAHSFNFGIGFKAWLLWLTLPQLMAGLVLAYLRVQYGLRWSIATHLAFDWILVLFAWTHHDATTMGLPMKLLAGVFSLLLLAMIVRGLFFLFRRGVLRAAMPEAAVIMQ